MTPASAIFDPMEALGWPRPPGMSAKVWRTGRDMAIRKLSRLDAGQLAAVAADVLGAVDQRHRMMPPGEIIRRADAMFPDPRAEKEREEAILRWMRCAEGRRAVEGDYALEMLNYIRRNGPGFVFSETIARLWRREAEKRRAARMGACRRNDAALIARIDAAVEGAIAMVEGRE